MKRAVSLLVPFLAFLTLNSSIDAQAPQAAPAVFAIRAGRLLDPDAGVVRLNQIIVIQGNRIRDVGPNVAIPAGAQVIDLSSMTVMPGLVDAHNHLALTYKPVPENNVYYYTYVQESTALRAIQAASNGIQMLASGFTSFATWATTAITRTPRSGRRSNRAGFPGRRSSTPESSSAAWWTVLPHA
jgi:imidazolonepropionase-like amidohydrolase